MNVADLADDSDSSDEDYVPNEKPEDLPSEIDEDDCLSDTEELNKASKRKAKSTTQRKKRQKNEPSESKQISETITKAETGQKKIVVDDLWADFVKDTGFKSKSSLKPNTSESVSSKPKPNRAVEASESTELTKKPPDKVKVTQIFEFAGEEVKVEKEVSADSAEARLLADQQPSNSISKNKRSGGLSGISNVLNQLTKKPKISTLEKTKLDWDSYKEEHKITEELETHNRGKDGYLERQDFLQRTDLRRFEIEKTVREVERNKRFQSSL